jgi:hypothetical protein
MDEKRLLRNVGERVRQREKTARSVVDKTSRVALLVSDRYRTTVHQIRRQQPRPTTPQHAGQDTFKKMEGLQSGKDGTLMPGGSRIGTSRLVPALVHISSALRQTISYTLLFRVAVGFSF